jgi:predicted RNA binding protein YcfA (HicA-like mRNA interferase family)
MPKWRALSGDEVLKILAGFGFSKISQRGSHAKLQRTVAGVGRQVLTVPLHGEIDRGTLHALYRQALRYLPETELRRHFQAD